MIKLAAVILAAGLSKRMGQPKMLLPWGQSTVLGQVIRTFAECDAQEIIVVSGGARELVEAEVLRMSSHYPVRCIYNPEHESGEMLSSLQCGLSRMGAQVEAALIGLGDQPQVSAQAVQSVVATFTTTQATLIVPSHQYRRGHPWLVERSLWGKLMEMQPPLTLRDFLNDLAGKIQYVETDHTVLKDLDTPEEYQREKP